MSRPSTAAAAAADRSVEEGASTTREERASSHGQVHVEEDVLDVGEGVVVVIDWTKRSRTWAVWDVTAQKMVNKEDICVSQEDAKTFNNMDDLETHLDEPCEHPVAMRLIHAVNVPDITETVIMYEPHGPLYNVTQNRFREWAKRGAQQKATSLGGFSWEAVSHGEPRFAGHFMDEVFCSLDYFGSCPQADPKGEADDCSGCKHAFSLETLDGGVHTACPRRMSITLRQGRLPDKTGAESDWFIDRNSPAFQLVVSEDSRHTTSQLGLRRNQAFYPAGGPDIDSIGSWLVAEHLNSIFKSLGHQWETLIDLAVAHCRNLEERIYVQPDDDSPAQKLWATSKNWLTVERLLRANSVTLSEFASNMETIPEGRLLAGSPLRQGNEQAVSAEGGADNGTEAENEGAPSEDQAEENNPGSRVKPTHISQRFSTGTWLKTLQRCSTHVEDDLIKPTTALLDMMYKSVAIRDTRLSLELNASLWRLSWITFIFLPLTFLSGFFGMNVDLFADDPSIKWYFVAAVVLATFFLLVWIIFKLAGRRRQNMKRGRQGYTSLA